jgi:hypothetical protein
MQWLKKSPHSIRSPSGLEWVLWRKLPWIAIAGTLAPLGILAVLHFFGEGASDAAQERWLQRADFIVGAVVLFHWTMVITVGIGCCIVMVMKGPSYLADSYHLSHSDEPRTQHESEAEAAQYRSTDNDVSPTPPPPPTSGH